LGVWRGLGFNFILLTAIGEIFVPRNVEKFAFFTVHLKTITSSERFLNNGATPEKTLHKAGHIYVGRYTAYDGYHLASTYLV
jgi:hypothetical protein